MERDWFQWASEKTAGWPSKSEIPQGVRLNLGCGNVILSSDEGWVNVDNQRLEGVDIICNLFQFPWPFPDNYADYIIASHLIEHIPHQVALLEETREELSPGGRHRISDAQGWRDMILPPTYQVSKSSVPHPLDGFFAFFAECWRILKPNGVITCIAPYGASDMALQDPTHTRSIVPATFAYLAPSADSPFDYGLPFLFEIERLIVFPAPHLEGLPEVVQHHHMRNSWNAGHTIRCDLRAVKP